jgi:hypothetical protein
MKRMSQPVKLSDGLILEARLAAQTQERSIAGQVEFWAKLGRSVVELLDGRAQQRLIGGGKRKSLTELVESVESPEGRARLKTYLEGQPYPHFEAHPTRKGLLIRIEADGRKTVGRFKNRQFVEASDEACKPVKRPVARKVRRIGRSLAASKRMPKGRAVAAAHAL